MLEFEAFPHSSHYWVCAPLSKSMLLMPLFLKLLICFCWITEVLRRVDLCGTLLYEKTVLVGPRTSPKQVYCLRLHFLASKACTIISKCINGWTLARKPRGRVWVCNNQTAWDIMFWRRYIATMGIIFKKQCTVCIMFDLLAQLYLQDYVPIKLCCAGFSCFK